MTIPELIIYLKNQVARSIQKHDVPQQDQLIYTFSDLEDAACHYHDRQLASLCDDLGMYYNDIDRDQLPTDAEIMNILSTKIDPHDHTMTVTELLIYLKNQVARSIQEHNLSQQSEQYTLSALKDAAWHYHERQLAHLCDDLVRYYTDVNRDQLPTDAEITERLMQT